MVPVSSRPVTPAPTPGALSSTDGGGIDVSAGHDRRSAQALLLGAVVLALVGVLGASAASGAISGLLALWLVHGVALPLALVALRPDLTKVVVAVALALAVAVPLVQTATTVLDPPGGQVDGHDGGVIVTRAAADDLLGGQNPYASDYFDDLPSEWQRVSMDGSIENAFANPIRAVYPYLPGAFLAMVPLQVLDSDGPLGDPRWVMLATYVAALVAIARWRDVAPWARVAALAASSGPLVTVHLSQGTNDTWAASLLVLAAASLRRRPVLAGALAALAVSVKFLILPPLLVWAAWTWRHEGWAAIRRLWSMPAVLAATCLPFLVWSPRDLMNDTVLFWAGRSEVPFPASGYGLAAMHPDIVRGPVLAVAMAGFAALGATAAWFVLRRWPVPAALPVACGLGILGLLIPARTFQGNYFVLVAGLLATGWLLVGRTDEGASEVVLR